MSNIFYSEVDKNLQQELNRRGQAGVEAGAAAGAVGAGVDAGAVIEVFTLFKIPLSLSLPPDFKNRVEVMANTAMTAANIQVPFSSTSVVCLTPMKLLVKPPTLAFKPPPFGF